MCERKGEGGREGGKEGGREGGKEGRREGGKEGRKEREVDFSLGPLSLLAHATVGSVPRRHTKVERGASMKR